MTGKEVLRAIADGADPSEFEVATSSMIFYEFKPCMWSVVDLANTPANFRRKPRTRVVNGFTVPAPIQEMPTNMSPYFLALPDINEWFGKYDWDDSDADRLWFSRGLLFSTKEAAIANAKAMCGINPESEA
jgi:hypothetical protein